MAINFKYFFKESASSMRRNMALTVAAIMVTSLSLVLLGAVGMMVHAGNNIAGDMKERVDEIRVFLKDDISPEEVQSMKNFMTRMSEVKSAKFISKEEAMVEYRQMFKDQKEMLDQIEGNPLPASFRVRMTDPKYNSVVAGRLETRPEVSVDSNGKKEIKNEKDVVDKVLRVTGMVQKIGFVVVIAFGIVAIALVSITIRMAIYSRRKEIGIMKLVGATNWFIRWPFMMEGVFEGFLGAVFAIIVTVLLQSTLIQKFGTAAGISNLVTGGYTTVLALVLILFGIFIGALGSGLALRRFVEV
ncbi:MAG TPA: permease-like cell division protein FtsX [Candidatus Anoxymicrobiaceae bacterium]|jgi:cell division transport system permease protein